MIDRDRLEEIVRRLGPRPYPANFAGMNRDLAEELVSAAEASVTLAEVSRQLLDVQRDVLRLQLELSVVKVKLDELARR